MADQQLTEAASGSSDHEQRAGYTRERATLGWPTAALSWPTTAECARRLTIGRVDIVRFVRLPDGDPLHLPGVLVPARGGSGWRVHPEVFEKWCLVHCSPSPPPAGAMNTEQLIEFLAGERIPSRSGLYRWWLQRVAEAVEFGVLTDYLVIGRPRWSPTEAAGVKDALDGIKGGTRTRAQEARHALAAKMVGLAGVAEAVRLKGVKRKTAEGWSGQGDRPVRFGARRVGGEVFFELAQLEAYTPTIPAEKAITIMRKCAGAGCVAQVPRTPSQIERTRDSYCSDCWSVISGTAQHLELLRDGLRTLEENNPEELFRRRSEGQQRREGKRGGSAGDATAILKAHNSPTKKRKRLTEMKLTRGGSLPSDEQMARWDEQANSRRARSADRSAKSQDLASKLVAALERGLTLTAAAQQEGCEFRTAQRLVRAAGVGPRQPGRPAKARAA